jgi:hypothetical protein
MSELLAPNSPRPLGGVRSPLQRRDRSTRQTRRSDPGTG